MKAPRAKWIFGNEALDETRRFAQVARRIINAALSLESPSSVLAGLTATLERVEQALESELPASLHPRVGPNHEIEGRVYLDHSRDVGAYNPCFPVYDLAVEGDHAVGHVRFPVAFEGPPGLVHGGFLAVLFDLAIQQHNCDVGLTGKTTRLEIGFRAPTPLEKGLRIEIDRRASDRRIESEARLYDGDTLCALATMRVVASDRDALPAVSPRRST